MTDRWQDVIPREEDDHPVVPLVGAGNPDIPEVDNLEETEQEDESLLGRARGAASKVADTVDEAIRHYAGPTGIPERATQAAELFSPVTGIGDAMDQAGKGNYKDAALETAYSLAPGVAGATARGLARGSAAVVDDVVEAGRDVADSLVGVASDASKSMYDIIQRLDFDTDTIGSNLGNIKLKPQTEEIEELKNTPATPEARARLLEESQLRPKLVPDFTPPKNTVTAYRMFEVVPGTGHRSKRGDVPMKVRPLYVNKQVHHEPDKWYLAFDGEKTEDGRVKAGGLGSVAHHPGYHSVTSPNVLHIGQKVTKDQKGPVYRSPNHVWAEVEVPTDIDYQNVADRDIKVPLGGSYRVEHRGWIISGSMKISRFLASDEVKALNKQLGTEDDLPSLIEYMELNHLSPEDLGAKARSDYNSIMKNPLPKKSPTDVDDLEAAVPDTKNPLGQEEEY